MKAIIVGNFDWDRQESMQRFARLLAEGLASQGIETRLVTPPPRFSRLVPRYQYSGWRKYVGYLDKFWVFPRRLRRLVASEGADVVHIADHANSVYASAVPGTPTLVTCHDLMQIRAALGEIPLHRPRAAGRAYQRWILRTIAEAPQVACVSRKTLEDLGRLASRPPGHTHLVYNGLNHPYQPVRRSTAREILAARGAGPWDADREGFYLNVGGGQWYKNRRGLLEIYAEILRRQSHRPPALVMVGKPLAAADRAYAEKLGLMPRIHSLAGASNDQLASLYSLARGLIFPSWDEGFGWPIAEAQACGCPVFTSGLAPMTEVGGDAAVYFDPARPGEAARAILAASTDEALYRARGLTRAARWSAERMLAEYAQLYRQLAAVPA